MSREKFDINCPGCWPVILDTKTLKPLPDNHPAMVKARKAFSEANHLERLAWHAVTCNGSRSSLDMTLVEQLLRRIK